MSTQLLPIVVHEVTGCQECPLYDNGSDYADPLCKHPESPDEYPPIEGPPPDWCPLRRHDLLVELKRER